MEGTIGQTIVILQLGISTELNINLRPVQRKHFCSINILYQISSLYTLYKLDKVTKLSKGSASGGGNKFGDAY